MVNGTNALAYQLKPELHGQVLIYDTFSFKYLYYYAWKGYSQSAILL